MAAASTSDVMLTSETLAIASWPHAVLDCPSAWSTPSPSPCTACFCFVCDAPFSTCDDPSLHASADGTQESWRRAKRRRSACFSAWPDIPALVNLIVQLSVDEARCPAVVSAVAAHPCTGSPTFVEMTAAFGQRQGLQKDAVDGVIKGMNDVSICGLFCPDKEQSKSAFAECEFGDPEFAQQDSCARKIVKAEIASPVVHPAPE